MLATGTPSTRLSVLVRARVLLARALQHGCKRCANAVQRTRTANPHEEESMALDAIALLKAQHKSARELLKALVATTDRGVKTRKELLAKIQSELSQHMAIEEEIFYPEFKRAVETKKDKRLYYEAQEEHKAAKKVLKDIVHADPATVAFGGKVKVLMELVEHHIEEEEQEMFPKAREAFS